ncbi:MAG: hypothetical protein AB7G40_01330 [Hyphomonadaceae bacterium]
MTTMPRRKELRGAAFGLLGSFVSRNNDVSGYWALGMLYGHAVKTNAPSVCVDLLDLKVTPPDGVFSAMAAHFQQMLGAQLSARHVPVDWVRRATICVDFGRVKSPNTPGDVFNAVVVITDDRGRAHSATANGACWIHDPARELKSTRA